MTVIFLCLGQPAAHFCRRSLPLRTTMHWALVERNGLGENECEPQPVKGCDTSSEGSTTHVTIIIDSVCGAKEGI
jgi:hypothetical protein